MTAPPAPYRWDDCWRAALARCSDEPCWLTVFGDSVSAGWLSSNWQTQGWVSLLRARLLADYPLHGDYYPATFSPQFDPTLAATARMPWTIATTGSPTLQHWGYNPAYAWTAANHPTPSVVFDSAGTPSPDCCAIDLLNLDQNPGTFTVSVDGGQGQVLTSTGDRYVSRCRFAGLDPGRPHTLAVTGESTDYAAFVQGAAAYQHLDHGIGFARLTVAGRAAVDFLPVPAPPRIEPSLLWQGIQPDGTPTGFGFPAQPHLALIALGLNDCNAGIDQRTYGYALQRLCQGLRRGRAGCSILFVILANPSSLNSDVGGGFRYSEDWPLYSATVYQLAQAFGAAVVNIHARWEGQALARGWQCAREPHPTDAGHQAIADLVCAAVCP